MSVRVNEKMLPKRNYSKASIRLIHISIPDTVSKGDSRERYRVIVRILNQIISSLVVDAKGFSLSLAQNTILSEMGTEIQGTWVNMIGQGAAKAVEGIIHDHAQAEGFISSTEKRMGTSAIAMAIRKDERIKKN